MLKEVDMIDKNKPKSQPTAADNKKTKKSTSDTGDDRPRREDEQVGDLLRSPSPEDGGSSDEKGVVPGSKKSD